MLQEPISITALSSLSAINPLEGSLVESHASPQHFLSQKTINKEKVWVGALNIQDEKEVELLRLSESKYRKLDDSVLYAILASRRAVAQAAWTNEAKFGINIGSSRGATSLFEQYHKKFLEDGKAPTLSSPTTTLGNISSWVAHDLQSNGPVISHSITCSTALHAILNGVAWIQSGMVTKFLVGGSEAPLTPFTLSQMKALKIYSNLVENYPCQALNSKKKSNTMVLGEGAAMACLEKEGSGTALAKIIGIGYATELLSHNVSISANAKCFQDSMKMALGGTKPHDVDAIVLHAPGTLKGDDSEVNAVKKVFKNSKPFLTTNKWKLGHTFGASGMLSVETAVLMLQHQKAMPVPFVEYSNMPKTFDKVMVNAVGFGGNAVSILLSR